MPRSLFLTLILVYPLSLSAQSTPEFPTDNEITTLMQQANLGMKEYQAAMQEEATKVGKDADSKQREKNAFENWQLLMSVVKTKPDNFNSGVGFMVVDQLNNAYQDALACEINAVTTLSAAFVLKDESHQSAAKDVTPVSVPAGQVEAGRTGTQQAKLSSIVFGFLSTVECPQSTGSHHFSFEVVS